MHVLGAEERALPRGAVLEREPARVEARDHAERRRRGREVQHARGAGRVQRRGDARPLAGQAGEHRPAGDGAVAAPSVDRTAHGRRADQHRPHRTDRTTAEHHRPEQQPHVHDEVPRDEREHRRREQVDARPAADAVDDHAQHERAEHRDDAHPRAPTDAAHRARHTRLARADALEHELRAAGEERVGAGALPDDRGGGAARPLAVGVGPQHPVALAGLDGARGGHLEGGLLVHTRHSMRARGAHHGACGCRGPARGLPTPRPRPSLALALALPRTLASDANRHFARPIPTIRARRGDATRRRPRGPRGVSRPLAKRARPWLW
ncbi:hypothetical protein AVP42_00327 [Agromyces sp. NDB4Y10]|nr:hypothetical protein AVP42_00327 [Agromyces sp. NDB4Y10]